MFDTMRWSEPTTPHDDTGPPTIKNHSVTSFNGYLYCFGGYDGRRNHMTLLLYSLVDQMWIPTKTLVNNSYHNNNHHHHHQHQHQHHQHHQNTGNMTAAPNTGARNAIPVEGLPPPGRNGHTATLAKDDDEEGSARIIIIGGWLGSGPLAASDVHVLELHHGESNNTTRNSNNPNHTNTINNNSSSNSRMPSLRWYQPPMKGLPPGPCNMHSADFVAKRREVYVFRGGNGREYLNDLHALHVDTYQWRKVETTGEIPQQRANHSSALLEETGELFVFGGWNGRERLNDIHILDTETSTWTRPDVGGVLPHPRAGMTLTALRGRLFLFGGSGTSSKCFQDLQILDRKEMAWLDVEQSEGRNASNRPTNYNNGDHADFDSLVATGGGGGGNAVGLTDWRSRDSNTLLSTSSSLSAMMMPNMMTTPNPNDEESVPTIVVQGEGPGRRAGHTATAVNRRLYVFGGSCGSDYLNDFFVLDTDPPPRAVVTEPASVQLMERRLRHFWNDEEFSDVTFVVEGRRVFGHKLILSIVSDCFRAMFTTGFRESEANAEIEIHHSSYDAFMAMMEYIYTGRVSQNLVEMHSICDLLELADQFFLDHLKQRCEMLLQSEVNVDTVEYLQQVAQKTNATQLLKICAHFQRNEANRI